MPVFTTNNNLYKWMVNDTKQMTITEMASNAEKIDSKFQEHASQLADLAINVKSYGAVGDGVTNDSQAILNALAVSKNLYFPDGEYLITFNPDVNGSFFTFTDQKNIRIKGKGATIKDGNTYTVDALTNVFKFVRCQNVDVDVNFDAIPLTNPNNDLGYMGSSALYFEDNCSFIKVDSIINNMRYGVRSGDYSDATKGYCKNFNLRLKTSYTGYPTALYLSENIQVNIEADGVHRAGYFAGCHHVRGVISYGGFAMATANVLLTNSLTSVYTTIQADQRARGCVDVNLMVIDRGSTSNQTARAMTGLAVQWVATGTVFKDINITLNAKTDDNSRTLAGFQITSKVKTQRTEYLYNWEDYIEFRNIKVSGVIDRTAQTIGNSAWGDIFVEGYDPDDTSYTHAPVFSKISFENLSVLKKDAVAMNNNVIRMPKLVDMLLFQNVMAKGINFTISTPQGKTKISSCVMKDISSYDTIAELIQEDSTLNSVAASVVTKQVLRNAKPYLFADAGYDYSEAGRVTQWKKIYYNVAANTDQTFTFPISFPNAVMSVQLTVNGISSVIATVMSTTKDSVTIRCNTQNQTIYLLAIGY